MTVHVHNDRFILSLRLGQDLEKGLMIKLGCVESFLGGPHHFTLRKCPKGKTSALLIVS